MGEQYFIGLENVLGGSGDPAYPGGQFFNMFNLGKVRFFEEGRVSESGHTCNPLPPSEELCHYTHPHQSQPHRKRTAVCTLAHVLAHDGGKRVPPPHRSRAATR
jgi:hypothetical protein